MPARTRFSAQTFAVLSALADQPADWRHGYDLARETGLRPGTLYPILIRLADQQLVDARWADGEPRRHQYQLTPSGLAAAAAASADSARRAAQMAGRRPAPRRRIAAPRPAQGEGS
jgi:PadR family transcriptional regulator, regulatory protein PadR